MTRESDKERDYDRRLARQIVRQGLQVLDRKEGKAIVKGKICELKAFSNVEKQGFAAMKVQIESYCDLKKPDRPLCLGVFGPPGSGKSFAVKQILASMKEKPETINLSQLEGPNDLAAAIVKVASARTVPLLFLFFDEFDSRLAGAPLGWLQWLLAPMQDGIVIYQGARIELKRAVYFFAGGTSDSFESFPRVHEGHFREAKGPDFISRLRGHINVRGVNDEPYRRVRRAVILRKRIDEIATHWIKKDEPIAQSKMSDDLIDRILAVGRFIHGSRSVESLIDMSKFVKSKPFTEKSLPRPESWASHVDLGPLAGTAVALSAGGKNKKNLNVVWQGVAIHLLELGAGLIYGGDFRESGLTQVLMKATRDLPNPLGTEGGPGKEAGARPRPARFTCFGSEKQKGSLPDRLKRRVDFQDRPGLTKSEFHELGLDAETGLGRFNSRLAPRADWKNSKDWRKQLGRCLELFRLRAEIARVSDARIAFFGRDKDFWGRIPGIAEEIMLSLAYKKPLYLCGAFEGATQAVGEVLGLGNPWIETPFCLLAQSHPAAITLEAAVKDWGDRFQLPHRSDLPLDYEGLVRFLRAHAVNGSNWPDNGLSLDENRMLFRSKEKKTIVELVEKGLRRRFGTRRQEVPS